MIADKFDFYTIKDFDRIVKLNPQERYDETVNLIKKLNNSPESMCFLNEWNICMSEECANFEAKILKKNELIFNDKIIDNYTNDWNKDLFHTKNISAKKLEKWKLFCLARDRIQAEEFNTEIVDVANKMGFQISTGQIIRLGDDCKNVTGLYVNAIREECSKSNTQFVVCITPSNSKQLYEAIKKVCSLEFSLPSQVIVSKTLKNSKTIGVIMRKVAAQINCKLGGEIWALQMPVININLF